MSEPGFLLYKCRLCGKVSKPFHVPDTIKAVNEIACYGMMRDDPLVLIRPKQTELCACMPGRIGLADLIGCVSDTVKNCPISSHAADCTCEGVGGDR